MNNQNGNVYSPAGLATNTVAPGANKSTLFLGDLSAFCSEADINEIFSPYGEVLEIKIMRSEETHRNLSYGFIKFAAHNSAKKALNGLNGVLFCGRNLRVGWASYKNKKEPKILQHHDRMDSSSVHVSYISYQLNCIITEESLRILFSSFGVVLDTSIKKSYIDEQGINRQCGYGFVHFASSQDGVQSALASVAGLNDVTIDDVSYKCSVSHNLEKQLGDNRRPDGPQHFFDPFAQNSSPFHEQRRPHMAGGNFNNFNDNFPQQQQGWNNYNNRMGHHNYNNFMPNQRLGFEMNRREEPAHNIQRRFSPETHSQVFPRPQVIDSIDKSLVMRYRQKFVDDSANLSPQSMGMHGNNHHMGLDEFNYNRPLPSFIGMGEPKNEISNSSFSLPPSKGFFDDFKFPLDNSERDSMGSNDSSNSAQSFHGGFRTITDGMNNGFDLHRFLPDLSGSAEFREPSSLSDFF